MSRTAKEVIDILQQRLRASIVGRNPEIDLLIVALLADGHVLLEDYPGSGKTTMAKALGQSLELHTSHNTDTGVSIESMRRVQFTPDLLPSDVTGTTIFDPESKRFDFRPGPIFTHVLLADEINRTSPKVQSALLESMAEKQCTVDNQTHRLHPIFFVIATQNPLDLAGTFPLPTAQLDRFLFKICMKHISMQDEFNLLLDFEQVKNGASDVPKISPDDLLKARAHIQQYVTIAPAIKQCLVNIADETRKNSLALQGISTRSLVLAMPALQVWAFMHGRDYVSPSDIVDLAPHIFAHRLMMAQGSASAVEVIMQSLKKPVEVCARSLLK